MIASSPIAVTAIAWSTPLGDDLDAVWERMLAGESGLVPVPQEATAGVPPPSPQTRLRNDLAAAVPSVEVASPVTMGGDPPNPPARLASARMTALALPALRRALAAADCDPADDDVRMVLGTSLGAFLEGEPESAPLHAWADTLAREVGAAHLPVSLSTACSSGSDAILVGAELIRAGAARRVICGGVDVLTLSKRLAHSALGSMSPTMLRAFDLRHDGTLLGEGAGFLVLEAVPRRAPLAWLRGVGSANDAAGMTTPDAAGLGARYALERSLADAGLGPEAIGVINAHGSGTPLNDATEARAFHDVFGGPEGQTRQPRPIVFATKGNFGHSLGATGVLEAITVLLVLRTGQVPPVVGLEQPDPHLGFPLPQGRSLPCDARFGLSVTLGFGGFDTSLVFEGAR
jgi:3-oxoacyl-[acyl-carrier-protein] synthase II